jgi:hypothetical protein
MIRRTSFIAVMCASMLLLPGCGARLPTYPMMSDAESLRIVAERAESITSVSSFAQVSMTNSQGETVSFDAALVAEPPRRARLRAWKFGSPVMDLTILQEGVWAYVAARDGDAHDSLDLAALPAAGIAQAVEMLSGDYFRRAQPLPGESTVETLVVAGTAFDNDDVRCEIDRATLAPRRFIIGGSAQEMEFTLDRYGLVDETIWARRWTFTAPEGRIVLHLGDVELNAHPPESAFTPPARATRLP